MISGWIIDFIYIWLSDKVAYSDPQQKSLLLFAYPRPKRQNHIVIELLVQMSMQSNLYRKIQAWN